MTSLTLKSVSSLVSPIVAYAKPLAAAALPIMVARKPVLGWIAIGGAVTIAGVAVGVAVSKGWTSSLRENITERINENWPIGNNSSSSQSQDRNVGGDSARVEEPVLVARGNLSDLTKSELYDLARFHEIEGRSMMNKDELVVALKSKGATTEQAALVARGDLDELNKSELYDIARSHEIEGRSQMNKDELVEALEEVI